MDVKVSSPRSACPLRTTGSRFRDSLERARDDRVRAVQAARPADAFSDHNVPLDTSNADASTLGFCKKSPLSASVLGFKSKKEIAQ